MFKAVIRLADPIALESVLSPSVRTEGDYKDSRAIGSANLITALNMVHQRLLVDGTKSDDITALSHDIFNNILKKFTKDKLIRKRPENLRKTFQLV